MTTEKTIRPLREDDLDDLIAIREVAFLDRQSRTNPDVRQTHVDTLDYKYGLFVAGTLVASASWYPFQAHLYGRETTVFGLASVVSDPAHRRKGYVGDLLEHGLEMMRSHEAGWCLEYPFDTRFYRKFGWHTVANGEFYEVPPERFAEFDGDISARRHVDIGSDELDELDRIYRAWASRFNFTLSGRGEPLGGWKRILEGGAWSNEPRYAYLFENAYLILGLTNHDDSERVHVIDYAYATPEGRRQMLGFLGRFRGQSDVVRIQLPTGDPLGVEWSNFRTSHPHPLHARIVDLRAALAKLPADEIEVVLAVRDNVCNWNDGCFRVVRDNGELRLDVTDAEATLALDIRDLAQLLSGTVSAADAVACGLVEGDIDQLERLLQGIDRTSHMPLSDYF